MRERGLRRLAVIAVGIAALAFILALFQPFAGSGGGSIQVSIPKDAGVGKIGDILDREGVVPSGLLFSIRARIAGDSGDLKPGLYTLRRHMTYGDVLDDLVHPALGHEARYRAEATLRAGIRDRVERGREHLGRVAERAPAACAAVVEGKHAHEASESPRTEDGSRAPDS